MPGARFALPPVRPRSGSPPDCGGRKPVAQAQLSAGTAMYYRELDEAWAELTAPDTPFETTSVDIRGVPTRTFRRAPTSADRRTSARNPTVIR